MTGPRRKYTWGPTFTDEGATTFRLWAPYEDGVKLALNGQRYPMTRSNEGWHRAELPGRPVGSEYGFVLLDGSTVPDLASRSQQDVLGLSRVVDPDGYVWENEGWKGREWRHAVIYEVHIGSFTSEGTFRAAAAHLAYLAELGFTAIEIMPIAHFPGQRGWGYDGVFQYAPFLPYGTTDDLKAFVDRAHGLGLMVLLDVVYNHFGPRGNFLAAYAPEFFLQKNPTPWGPRIDFSNQAVRRFFIENAIYWLDEFRFDGLRLDAIDQIEDQSEVHFLEELAEEAYASVTGRTIHLVTENPANGTDLMALREGKRRLYAADWNDDFHHAMHAAASGERTGHYAAFAEDPWRHAQKALATGYLTGGRQVLKSVTPPPSASLPTISFVHFLQNHDQVGNRALGDRLHQGVDRELYAALTEILLLSPQIPLLFQGDDHLSRQPFRFFADYEGDLRTDVWKNREREAMNFGGFPSGSGPEDIPDPSDLETFAACKLKWDAIEGELEIAWRTFLQRLLLVRRDYVVPLLGEELRGGRAIDAPDSCIFVDWTYPTGLLQLRANLGKNPVMLDRDVDIASQIYPPQAKDQSRALEDRDVRVFHTRSNG